MEILDLFRPQVEQELEAALWKGGGCTPPGLALLYCYHMGFCDRDGIMQQQSRGKYLRPTLCLAMCSALKGNADMALGAAASLELLHRTSLVFDDIQDQGKERNNRPTVWAVWGENQAINAGLALSCFARLALHRMRQKAVPDDIVLAVHDVLERAVIDLCWGQYRDVFFAEGGVVTLDDYIEMIRGKTAALFGACCEAGALCARADPLWVEQAREFGINLGLAFQMQDDYLGIWGDEAEVGKTANDLVEKKRSLPVVLALEADPHQMQSWLDAAHITAEDAGIIRAWMENRGIQERVGNLAGQYRIAAQEHLDCLPLLPEWRERLSGLVRFVTGRGK